MKKITKTLLFAVTILTGLVLVACGGGTPVELTDAVEALTETSILATGDTKSAVTKDLNLKTKDGEVSISWVSDNTDVIKTTGEVTRPTDADAVVELTATLTFDEKTEEVKFTVTVLKLTEITVTTGTAEDAGKNLIGDGTTNEAASLLLDPEIFTVITDGAGSWDNKIGLYEGAYRLYGDRDTGDGNKLSISIAEGYEIVSLEIVLGAGTNSPDTVEIKLDEVVQELTSGQAPANYTFNYEDLSLTSFSIKNNNVHADTTKQV